MILFDNDCDRYGIAIDVAAWVARAAAAGAAGGGKSFFTNKHLQ